MRRVIQEAQAQMRPEIFDRSTVCWSLTGFSYEVQINVGRFHLEREIEAQKRRGHIVSGWDSEALKATVGNGYSEKQGARRMRNTARETVHEAIGDALLRGREAGGQLDYNGQSKTFFLNRQR